MDIHKTTQNMNIRMQRMSMSNIKRNIKNSVIINNTMTQNRAVQKKHKNMWRIQGMYNKKQSSIKSHTINKHIIKCSKRPQKWSLSQPTKWKALFNNSLQRTSITKCIQLSHKMKAFRLPNRILLLKSNSQLLLSLNKFHSRTIMWL